MSVSPVKLHNKRYKGRNVKSPLNKDPDYKRDLALAKPSVIPS